jgi:hypothetical protein
MPDNEFIKWVFGQTGMTAVALILIWVLRDQINLRVCEAKENKEQLQEMIATVIDALKANSAAFAEQSSVMRDLKELIKELRNVK